MNLLGSKKSASEIAEEGVSLFRSAIVKLKASSEQAATIVETNTATIKDLQTESDAMNKLAEDNAKVINNISAIIDVE